MHAPIVYVCDVSKAACVLRFERIFVGFPVTPMRRSERFAESATKR